jgi:hypothetical protein
MPATPLISAFVPSNQTAIGQLAAGYCGQLVANPTYLDAFFGTGTGLDAALNSPATWFGASGSPQRAIVINAMVNNAVGTAVNPASAAAVQSETDALLTRLTTAPIYTATPTTVASVTVSVCTAVLGSAAVMLQ